MTATWSQFKSSIRNKLTEYCADDVLHYVIKKIRMSEPLGLAGAIQKYKLNLPHLFSIFRWGIIYGQQHRRLSKPFGENDFIRIYNGMQELGWREIPKNLSPEVLRQFVLREGMRNQHLFQINSLATFMIFVAIVLFYCDERAKTRLASEIGFDSIDDFLLSHYLLAVIPVIQKVYVRDLTFFETLKNPGMLEIYIREFIPSFAAYKSKVSDLHAKNKADDTIWKEVDDMTWYMWNPFYVEANKVQAISLSALSHYAGYGMLSIISSNYKWFYESEFSTGFENFILDNLRESDKVILTENKIGSLIPGVKQRPDAFFEFNNTALFMEFKSNKTPCYIFESSTPSIMKESIKSSLYKGMTQIFSAMKKYKELHPEKSIFGVIITLHEYHSGIPSVFANEVLSQAEIEEYQNEITQFGIVSLYDFLAISRMKPDEFTKEIISRIGRRSFYQFAGEEWSISEIPKLQQALDRITEIAGMQT